MFKLTEAKFGGKKNLRGFRWFTFQPENKNIFPDPQKFSEIY